MKEIKNFAAYARKQHYLNTCFLKGQYHAVFSNTLKIKKTLFG